MELFDDNKDCYMPSFFVITLNTSIKIKKILSTCNSHTLFHEYIHFLQDVTTSFAYINTSIVFNRISKAINCCNEIKNSGKKEIILPIIFNNNNITDLRGNLSNYYLGYYKAEENISNKNIIKIEEQKNSEETKFVNPMAEKEIRAKRYQIVFEDWAIYKFGAHAIMEGICDKLEQTVFDIKLENKRAPYDLAYLVACYYDKRFEINTKAFLDLSEFSLMFPDPAEVFIISLQNIKNKRIEINNDLYSVLNGIWLTSDNKRTNELFFSLYDLLVKDIDATFTNPVFGPYKNWLLKVLKNGYELRTKGKPIFSEFLNYDKTTIKGKLDYCFENIGLPLIVNQEGDYYIYTIFKKREIAICNIEKFKMKSFPIFFSFFLALTEHSVYKCLIGKESECEMKNICNAYYERGGLFAVDSNCNSKPWIKDHNCPFSTVWNLLGLDELQITKEVVDE